MCYLRVSTGSQSYDSQYHALKEYCDRNGYKDVQFLEETASGSKQRRPVLDNIIENVKKGKVKTILCWRLDRLARSIFHLSYLLDLLGKHGCAFVSVTDLIDTSNSSPTSAFQIHILGAVSQLERSLIRERVVAGLKAARAKGRFGGRPSLPQATTDRIRHMLAEGFHPRAIARECGTSVASVYKAKKHAVLAT